MALIAEGSTNVEIAARLFISKRTVESHIEHAKRKLAARKRPQLMAWGLQHHASPTAASRSEVA